MSSRRKMARKRRAFASPAPDATIQLANPVSHHFESFVLDNALTLEAHMAADLEAAGHPMPRAIGPLLYAVRMGEPRDAALAAVRAFRDAYTAHCGTPPMVQPERHAGQHVVICGAGPSLADHAHEYCADADHVWGCNSALPYLIAQGHRVTHGFTVDQTPAMVDEWATAPDVEYVVPSTIHPHLAGHLAAHNRRLTWFHNYVGIQGPSQSWPDADGTMLTAEYEDWLYVLLYPPTFRAGSGLNTVTRAVDVALHMGFARITVLGADHALRVTSPKPDDAVLGSPAYTRWLRESTVMHADGGHALASGATAVTMQGEIDGRVWTSKPDMLISAVWLEKMRRNHPDRITLVGDTLPNALRDKSETFLARLPALVDSTGRAIMVPSMNPTRGNT